MAGTVFQAEPGKQETVMTRSFDAPRELVFKAFTDPGLVPLWWGPRTYTTVVDELDARPGGLWRFIQKGEAGSEYAFHGVFHEVAAPGRLVYTFEYEGMPGHVLLETILLETQDGVTRMTDRTVFQSVADRDGMVASGMESGAAESIERLAELLVSIRIGG